MKSGNPAQKVFNTALFTIMIFFFIQMFTVCATAGSHGGTEAAGGNDPVTETKKGGLLTVQSPQETIYNGEAQPVSFVYTGEDTPVVVYFLSPQARETGTGGTHTPPVQAGTYYVEVLCEHEYVFVDYRVLKCPVKIEAEETQRAFYDGNPKRISATIVPAVPVSYSYYPNPELREMAKKAVMETVQREIATANTAAPLTTAFKGYKRIDRAPTEQGNYFVWIYFAGDENHEPASANVDFIILPPQGR